MIKISKLADYGVFILSTLSHYSGYLSAKCISECTSISMPTVSKLLKILETHDVLVSKLGKKGGYKLSADPKKISLLEIVNIVDGEFELTSCSLERTKCRLSSKCTLHNAWGKINLIITNLLQQISLYDLVHNIKLEGHICCKHLNSD